MYLTLWLVLFCVILLCLYHQNSKLSFVWLKHVHCTMSVVCARHKNCTLVNLTLTKLIKQSHIARNLKNTHAAKLFVNSICIYNAMLCISPARSRKNYICLCAAFQCFVAHIEGLYDYVLKDIFLDKSVMPYLGTSKEL